MINNLSTMKKVLQTILAIAFLWFSVVSCISTKEETPPYPHQGAVVLPPIPPPTPISVCGTNPEGFAPNTFSFNGKCYKISTPISAYGTANGSPFWLMGGHHDLGKGNYVQLHVYFKEKTYSNDNFLTVSDRNMGSSNVFMELIDASAYDSTKEYAYYYSEGNQVIPVKSTGAGVEVKFSLFTFKAVKGPDRYISAHLLIY